MQNLFRVLLDLSHMTLVNVYRYQFQCILSLQLVHAKLWRLGSVLNTVSWNGILLLPVVPLSFNLVTWNY